MAAPDVAHPPAAVILPGFEPALIYLGCEAERTYTRFMQWDDAGAGVVERARPAWAGASDAALHWLAARLGAERERWVLWFPVAMGTGIAVYFSLGNTPEEIAERTGADDPWDEGKGRRRRPTIGPNMLPAFAVGGEAPAVTSPDTGNPWDDDRWD